MKKFWAVLAILIIASLNLSAFAKGKSRYSVGKKSAGKKAKNQSLSLNTNFCEFINGSVGFLVCASGEAGDEKLTREDLYEIKQSSVLLSKKIQTSKAKKIAFKRQKSKNTRKASKIVNANAKYCSVLKGTPNITVCAQGKPGQAAITSLSLSSVQEAALAVQKKYNKANKSSFIKYVIDNMSVQSCEYIYGAGDYRCDENYEEPTCDPSDCYCHEMNALPPPTGCESSTCDSTDCYCHEMNALPPPAGCESSTCDPTDCYCHEMNALPPPAGCEA